MNPSTVATSARCVSTDGLFGHAIAQLKATGHRVTEPRRALIRALIASSVPISIEALHTAAGVRCDLVTVYRCADAFESAGIVRRVFSHSGTALIYLYSAPERFHVVDRETGEALPIGDASAETHLAIQKIEDRLRAAGFRDVGHVVQFFADAP